MAMHIHMAMGGQEKLGHGDELDQIQPKKITAFEEECNYLKEAACGRDHYTIGYQRKSIWVVGVNMEDLA